MPALKEATDGALTTDAGRRFQAVATLLSKKLVLGFDLAGSRSIATRSTLALVLISSSSFQTLGGLMSLTWSIPFTIL